MEERDEYKGGGKQHRNSKMKSYYLPVYFLN